MSNKIRRPRSLSKSLVIGSIIIVVVLCLTLETIGLSTFRSNMQNRYEIYITDLIEYVMNEIDGDDLEYCIKTLTKTQKYEELQVLLDKIKETHEIDYIYIIKPLSTQAENNMMDVIAGVSEKERRDNPQDLTWLGKLTGTTYPPEIAALYMGSMTRRQKVSFFRDNIKQFNDDYTGTMPILNSNEEPIALLCVDIPISDLKASMLDYSLMSIVTMIIMGSLLALIMIYWLKSHVIYPISEIETSLSNFVRNTRNVKDAGNIRLIKPNISTPTNEFANLSESLEVLAEDLAHYMEKVHSAAGKVETLRRHMDQMDEQSFKDSLTSVKNRSAYEKASKKLNWDIENHNAALAIVMIDLNNLSDINENYGRECGDSYIKKLARMICVKFQHSPVYRIGGDEFLVVLQNEDLRNGDTLIDELNVEIAAEASNEDLQPWERVSAAIGMAVYEEKIDHTLENLLNRAEENMQDVKKAMKARTK